MARRGSGRGGGAPPFAASGARWRSVGGGETGVTAAVSVYDAAGPFAAEFPDAARLARAGVRSFYGEPAPPARAPRPVCAASAGD